MNKRRCRKFRNIVFNPAINCFKPCGIPLSELEIISLEADEIEAIRLIDFEGLYQQNASEKMNISRTTFARTVDSARKKISDAILNGKALVIIKTDSADEKNSINTENLKIQINQKEV
jgi:predicted DNA-binding protein (UPF0251 family)